MVRTYVGVTPLISEVATQAELLLAAQPTWSMPNLPAPPPFGGAPDGTFTVLVTLGLNGAGELYASGPDSILGAPGFDTVLATAFSFLELLED